MALTKQTVSQIINVVENDPVCKERINSWLYYADIADSGMAGAVRNLSIGLMYGLTPDGLNKPFDPSERSSMAYKFSCDGIAEATVNAIKPKIEKIPTLANVSDQARRKGYSHTGTLLEMEDKTKYVLDWWKSLNIGMPFVFKYNDFMYQMSEGTPFFYFKGYSD